MEITIERGHGHDGYFLDVQAEGVGEDRMYIISRQLTGCTNETGEMGIFQDTDVRLWFGNKEKTFQWEELNLRTDSAQELQRKLSARIAEVKAWIASETYSEEIKINL
jgi:hypothetical protein